MADYTFTVPVGTTLTLVGTAVGFYLKERYRIARKEQQDLEDKAAELLAAEKKQVKDDMDSLRKAISDHVKLCGEREKDHVRMEEDVKHLKLQISGMDKKLDGLSDTMINFTTTILANVKAAVAAR